MQVKMVSTFSLMQSSSFPASDYFDISSQNKKHFKVCIVCKGYREWTIYLFLHICFQGLSLGPWTKRGEKGKACQEITKGIQERSVSAYVCWEQTALGEKGDTWNMEHWPHHLPHIQNRAQSGQKTATPGREDLALLPLHIVDRLQTISPTG